MADDLLKRTQAWKPSVWCLLTIGWTFYATNTTFNYFRTEKNMSPTKEVVFPKIILFGDSITQVSIPFFRNDQHIYLYVILFLKLMLSLILFT